LTDHVIEPILSASNIQLIKRFLTTADASTS